MTKRKTHRRRGRNFFRWMGVGISSAASLLGSHTLHAKPLEIKETKNSKRERIADRPQMSFGDSPWNSYLKPELPTATMKVGQEYPWRRDIVTTTFWVGEKPTQNNPVPNHKSCWDTEWAERYGGTDTPDRKKRNPAFIPSDFVPGQNPFYVALPYNDMTSKGHKSEAAQVIPWYNKTFQSDNRSVCKGRWIAIRKGDRVCYAQWEDAGPFRTDHWQYVFGNERPKPNLNKGAGLDVSPAVRDFLGMDDTDMTDWKFVEFKDVPTGPWATYGDNNTFVMNRRAAIKIEELAAMEGALKKTAR